CSPLAQRLCLRDETPVLRDARRHGGDGGRGRDRKGKRRAAARRGPRTGELVEPFGERQLEKRSRPRHRGSLAPGDADQDESRSEDESRSKDWGRPGAAPVGSRQSATSRDFRAATTE